MLVRPSDEPVTVTVTVPVVAVLLAVKFSVLVLVVLLGLSEAVTPAGRPETDKLMVPLKPFSRLTLMVLAPLDPCGIVKLFGDAERVKLP